MSIAGDLEELKNNLDKFKKSGMGDEFDDVDIKTLDWVDDNKKVKAFFIYESSLWYFVDKERSCNNVIKSEKKDTENDQLKHTKAVFIKNSILK